MRSALLGTVSVLGAALNVQLSTLHVGQSALEAPIGDAQLPRFYHTTRQVSKELWELVGEGPRRCPGLTMETLEEGGRSIEVLRFRPRVPKPGSGFFHRAAIFAGEHARELITTETALNFVKEICRIQYQEKPLMGATELLIVVNANPGSRELVEQGEFCRRVNPDGVDLNRNWDINWVAGDAAGEAPRGAQPFSEPETKMLRKVLEDFKPHTFISVHAGNLGMYLSNGLKEHPEQISFQQNLIESIDSKYCKCPMGIADEQVGYKTTGSSLDYAAMKANAMVSLALEIFIEKDEVPDLRKRWRDAKERKLNPNATLIDPSILMEGANIAQVQSEFMRAAAAEAKAEEVIQGNGDRWCFRHFNPVNEELYKRVIRDWTDALTDIVNKVGSKLGNAPASKRLQIGQKR